MNIKLDNQQRNHYNKECETSKLIKRCYTITCAKGKLTPEKIYALCQLTWYDKDWTTNKLNALWILWNKKGIPPNVVSPELLTDSGIPLDVLSLVKDEGGINALYSVYRGSSKKWIKKNYNKISELVISATKLKRDSSARKITQQLQKLSGIPKPISNIGKLGPEKLLTPLIASLDPRKRYPIINGAKGLQDFFRHYKVAKHSLVEQHDFLVGLIGQYGIKDAHMLDAAIFSNSGSALKSVLGTKITKVRKKTVTKKTGNGNSNPLPEYDESDVEIITKSITRTQKKVHNKMTNALRRICNEKGLEVKAGGGAFQFDVLIENYNGNGRDMLVEAKSSNERPNLRLGVGQLLDYRRGLSRSTVTDMAILVPNKPELDSIEYIESIGGIKVLWFTNGDFKKIENITLRK